ncbi:hypothetical protein ASF41_23240 [Methylobacterium sp. Leaf111]|uniref:hypothetical protein n=1 Tax=Methylobacterium sp. Leaf111 TaxID=1736257 RepID=UPI0006F64FF6|nr:hypothetical protein [Methylobacterium sp. Leaf111]KQP53674.1 hypothetical protein ASF41_23240 [Methylobacterium sp. Leaf111]
MPCRITTWGESQARRWEIAENLHRADLTTLQRNEQVAEWIALTEAEAPERILGQLAPKIGRGRPEGGVRAAARELGIEHKEARRATKIASISPAAKEAARAAGLGNNQTALLRVAAAEPERQADVVQEIVAARPAARPGLIRRPRDPPSVFVSKKAAAG